MNRCDKPRPNTNIYGLPLEECRNDLNDRYGSWDQEGKCSNRGERDPGVHQICFRLKEDTKNFSGLTGQSNWSAGREGKPHCVCVGAWSLYKARQRNPDETIDNDIVVTQSSNELKCSAIPESALSNEYLQNWKTWNNYEKKFKLDQNYQIAVDDLVEQCARQAPNQNAREHLEGLAASLKKNTCEHDLQA